LSCDDASSDKKSTENVSSTGEEQSRHQDHIAQGPTKRFKPEVRRHDGVPENSSEYDKDCITEPDPVGDCVFMTLRWQEIPS
jgi:hypothetical protein